MPLPSWPLVPLRPPPFCEHDKPAQGNDTGGLDDSGLINFNASYDDWQQADVLFVSGTDPFESKTVLFTEFMMKGPKLIMAIPRRSTGVAYAESTGGLFLQVIPGTDTVLHMAISRYILEQGWEDQGIHRRVDRQQVGILARVWGAARATRRGSGARLGGNLALTSQGYKEWVLSPGWKPRWNRPKPLPASRSEKIIQAAEMLTGAGGERPKASFRLREGQLLEQQLHEHGQLCGYGVALWRRQPARDRLSGA